ncbi:uncharacterized protein LOC142976022 [Anticarsia gemmatalis]|uniref:uncharacterized protein LOC142976022 n=1 Tax=Anticarsia gemmatalis TaxID=129554 RepID=UPI003F771BDA
MVEEKEQEKANAEDTVEFGSKKNLCNVVHTVKPIHTFENIFGIFFFQMINGEIKPPNWKMKTFGILLLVGYIILFFCTLSLPTAITGTMNLVNVMDEVPGIVMLIQYVTCAITSSFLVNATYIRIINAFAELDTMLRVETITDFYKKSHTQTVKYLIILLFSHVINGVADFATAEVLSMSSMVALPLYLFQKLEILAFCKLIVMLKCRLVLINNYLTTFIQDQDKKNVTIFTIRDTKGATEEKFNFIGRASENNMKIRDLATMYDLIGKICSMINEVFNFQIFMTLVSTFIFIVITIWTSLYYYRKPENYSGPLINIAIWCFSAIYTVAVMSFTCERMLLVRNEAKVSVNKVIMNYDLPKTMRVQAKAFMELIEAWPLRIYIYDMFSVDITLMLKFISVATTYLIVIIQISHFV